MEIATLEARLRVAEERHRVTLDTTRVDRKQLAEAEYLVESLGAASVDYQERVWDLEERSRYNYYHLCHLGGRLYEEQDLASRTRTAWECSDQRRLAELEEVTTLLPLKKRPQLRAETVDGVYLYQTSIRLASGQVLCRSQGTLLPSSVNPRYRIRGTNALCKILSIKAENT
jgi:hypothetical protein